MRIPDALRPRVVRRALGLVLALVLTVAASACEDPARPGPVASGATLFVDSEPRGGRILIDGVDTGLETPALVDGLTAGARNVRVELDTAMLTYSFADLVVVDPTLQPSVSQPLTIRCTEPLCLRNAAEFHAPQNIRFAVNAAGPLFVYEGRDVGIVWPANTLNSYSPRGAATFTALVGQNPVALGLRNAGTIPNYWAGRPIPRHTDGEPYIVSVPAWITPPTPLPGGIRGIEIVQEVIVEADAPNALELRITWRNITADSLYRLLDPSSPAAGVTYTHAYVGFILDADIGANAESDDDLVSYDADRALVFAYDAHFDVPGFSGAWSGQPGLLGLMLLEGPGEEMRLNAWPRTADFSAGSTDAAGRALITAAQATPTNHPDARIGYAPDEEAADYLVSVATGPLTLAPGESVTARFAVLLAPPADGTFLSGVLSGAGDPDDPNRPLAATASHLLELAESLLDPPTFVATPAPR